MPKGGSRTARYAAPSRDYNEYAPEAARFGGRGQGFGVDAPCQQPNARAGGRGQNQWNAAMAARLGGRDHGFTLDGSLQQPNARAGGRGQSPWLEAEDEVITEIPLPFGADEVVTGIPLPFGEDAVITGIPVPFGLLKDLGSDSSSIRSHDDCLREPRCAPPQVQKLGQAVALQPFKLSAGQCDGGCPGPRTTRGVSNAPGGPQRQTTESGLYGSTTVMIRRIPQSLSQKKLVWELENAGFARLYDYIYIPLDRGQLARPMAFVNFTNGDAAERFFQMFDSRPLRSCGPSEPVFVIPATIQGLARNVAHRFVCVKRNAGGRREREAGPIFQI